MGNAKSYVRKNKLKRLNRNNCSNGFHNDKHWSINKIGENYFIEISTVTIGPMTYGELVEIYKDESNICKIIEFGNSGSFESGFIENVALEYISKNKLIVVDNNCQSQASEDECHNMPINKACPRIGFNEMLEEDVFKYVAYVNADDEQGWSRIKNLMNRTSIGFEKRFECKVIFEEEPIIYRGNMCYAIRFEAHNKNNIIKCRNSFPDYLKEKLILNEDSIMEINHFISEFGNL